MMGSMVRRLSSPIFVGRANELQALLAAADAAASGEAALELAQEGPGVQVPVDRARDEVGDLARTLAVMQQRLHSQEEARRSFVATASHELRTPLTSLDGMLELLDDDLRYADPDLEAIRQEVVAMPIEFPPSNPRDYCSETGRERMRQIVRDLRARSKSLSR